MTVSREFLQISVMEARDPELLVERMNFIFGRLMDRLDQLEGLRGNANVRGKLQIIDPDTEAVVGGFTDGAD